MLKVNGTECPQYAGCLVADMLVQEQYKIDCVAVELNAAILPKADYGKTVLQADDTVEVVSFVGGG